MRISGMLDYDAEALAALEQLHEQLFAVFGRYGYARVAPPILETADVFLERSGEEIRRRMYLLNDPGGRMGIEHTGSEERDSSELQDAGRSIPDGLSRCFLRRPCGG